MWVVWPRRRAAMGRCGCHGRRRYCCEGLATLRAHMVGSEIKRGQYPCRFCPPTTARSSLDEHAAWHGMICRACAEGRHASAPSKCHDDVSVPGSRCSPRRVHVPAHTPRNCADTQRVSRVGEARPTCMRDMAARACAHAEHASMRVETIATMWPAGAMLAGVRPTCHQWCSLAPRHKQLAQLALLHLYDQSYKA